MQVGAYGWLLPHWIGGFYPEDLPSQWTLSYYSNVFNTVMVPASYWQQGSGYDCDSWLEDVHEDFGFYFECPLQVLNESDERSLFIEQLNCFGRQLSGVVLVETAASNDTAVMSGLQQLMAITAVYGLPVVNGLSALLPLWQPDHQKSDDPAGAQSDDRSYQLAIFDDDLKQLRSARADIEAFAAHAGTGVQQTIIIRHVALQAEDLSRLRGVIEIMGL